jgi:hypothetical protein
MTDKTNETKPGQERHERRSALPAVAALLLLSIAAGAAWWFVLCPQARVRRNVKAMAAAFEARNADGILEHFSADYNDAAGNSYDDMDTALRDFILPLVEEVKIDIKSIQVRMEDGAAVAVVRGTILYKIKGVPQREKYEEDNPAILRFELDGRAWRVTSVENIGENLTDMQKSYDDIKSIF